MNSDLWNRRTNAVAAIVMMLVLSACSGGDDGGSESSDGAAGSAPADTTRSSGSKAAEEVTTESAEPLARVDPDAVDKAQDTRPLNERAAIRFDELDDGSTVASPVRLRMKTNDGLTVKPFGSPNAARFGYFAVAVDTGCLPEGIVVDQTTESLVVYADGGAHKSLDLEPGPHDLCLMWIDQTQTIREWTHEVSITVT